MTLQHQATMPLPNCYVILLALDLVGHRPDDLVVLEKDRLFKKLTSARRGAAGGASWMTAEHVRPVLDSERDGESFSRMSRQGGYEDEVVRALRKGRMLQKPSGGVRGIGGWWFLATIGCSHSRSTIGPRRRTCNCAVPVCPHHQVGM